MCPGVFVDDYGPVFMLMLVCNVGVVSMELLLVSRWWQRRKHRCCRCCRRRRHVDRRRSGAAGPTWDLATCTWTLSCASPCV